MNQMDVIKPICKCHNLEMVWENDDRKKKGGFWRCRAKLTIKIYKDNNSITGYIRKREWQLIRYREKILKELHELNRS